MIELLKKGTKIKVHPLEWFKGNYDCLTNFSNSETYYFKGDSYSLISPNNLKTHALISSSMLEFCGKTVTISERNLGQYNNKYYVTFNIKEYPGSTWLVDFLDLSTIYSTAKISEYCNNFCILHDICKSSSCSLSPSRFSSSIIGIEYDYIYSRIKYKLRVKPLEWFKKHCISSVRGNKSLDYRTSSSVYNFSLSMQKLCGKVVTIDKFILSNGSKCLMRIEEDYGIYDWILDFFDVPDNIDNYIHDYCKSDCVLGDRSKCNNSECPLFEYED